MRIFFYYRAANNFLAGAGQIVRSNLFLLRHIPFLAGQTSITSYRYKSTPSPLDMMFKVARYSFSRSIPPKFERKLRRHKQGFRKIDTTVVSDKEENWL